MFLNLTSNLADHAPGGVHDTLYYARIRYWLPGRPRRISVSRGYLLDKGLLSQVSRPGQCNGGIGSFRPRLYLHGFSNQVTYYYGPGIGEERGNCGISDPYRGPSPYSLAYANSDSQSNRYGDAASH